MNYFPRLSFFSASLIVASVVFLFSFVLPMFMDHDVQQPAHTDMAANALKNVVVVGGSYVGKVS